MSDLSHFHGLSKDEWCRQLDEYHAQLRATVPGFEGYGDGSVVENTGWEAWSGYFENGYTPSGALDEDRTYGEE